MSQKARSVAIAGVLEPTHVGQYFADAAERMGYLATALNTQEAFSAPAPIRKASWNLLGHRPPSLAQFNTKLIRTEIEAPFECLVTTGIAPITAGSLREFRDRGVRTALYLTDDPWNPAHRANWFLQALPFYDHVFSTRRSIMKDLADAGCRSTAHLPFAYEPSMHFPEPPIDKDESASLSADVVFVGGADEDRVGPVGALIEAGLDVALYGGYWNRYVQTRGNVKGHADPATVRKAIGVGKVALCLVRQANRDGTSMRTFEVPAMGGCPLVEYTEEHVELFGEDGVNVLYFRNDAEMIEKARSLVADRGERRRLADRARTLITSGANTYEDRLGTILEVVSTEAGT